MLMIANNASGPQCKTCRNHCGGEDKMYLFLPRYPRHQLCASMSDQLSPLVVQSRIPQPLRPKLYSSSFGMANVQCTYSGMATGMVSDQGNFSVYSKLLCNHESVSMMRNDIAALLQLNVCKGRMNAELAESIT